MSRYFFLDLANGTASLRSHIRSPFSIFFVTIWTILKVDAEKQPEYHALGMLIWTFFGASCLLFRAHHKYMFSAVAEVVKLQFKHGHTNWLIALMLSTRLHFPLIHLYQAMISTD